MINDQTSVPVSPADPLSTPPASESKKITPTIAVLILLGLVGGGAYAYYAGFFNFKKTETFEQVFAKAIDKISSQKYGKGTVEGNITIKDKLLITNLNFPADTYPQINFSYDAVSFREDLNDPSKDKISMNAKFNFLNILKDPISAEVDFLMPEQMIFYMK